MSQINGLQDGKGTAENGYVNPHGYWLYVEFLAFMETDTLLKMRRMYANDSVALAFYVPG